MISSKGEYRYADVSKIPIDGNTMPQRGTRRSPYVLVAEDLAALEEGLEERSALCKSKFSLLAPDWSYKNSGNGRWDSGHYTPTYQFYDPQVLPLKYHPYSVTRLIPLLFGARLCSMAGDPFQTSRYRYEGCGENGTTFGGTYAYQKFINPDLMKTINEKSVDREDVWSSGWSSSQPWGYPSNNWGDVCTWMLRELGMMSDMTPSNARGCTSDENRRQVGPLKWEEIARGFSDLKRLKRLFVPLQVASGSSKCRLQENGGDYLSDKYPYYSVTSMNYGPMDPSNPTCTGNETEFAMNVRSWMGQWTCGRSLNGEDIGSYNFPVQDCFCSTPSANDGSYSLYLSRKSGRYTSRYSYKNSESDDQWQQTDVLRGVCCNDHIDLETVSDIRMTGLNNCYAMAGGEVSRVYVIVRAWHRKFKSGSDENEGGDAFYLLSKGLSRPVLSVSDVNKKACRRYLSTAGLPEEIENYPDGNEYHGESCGVDLVAAFAIVEPKYPNIKIDVHNTGWNY